MDPDIATEARQRFLLALGDALRPLEDPAEIQATASRLLGERLGANRVTYFDIRGGEYVIDGDYVAGPVSMSGRHVPFAAYGPPLVSKYRSGHNAIVTDVAGDDRFTPTEKMAFHELEIGAFLGVPVLKGGKFAVGLSVHTATPREWTADEVALVEETAERTWAVVERARVAQDLIRSEKHYRTLFDSIDQGLCTIEVLFDEQGRPHDYRFLETNAAFERQTGLHQVVGKRIRDLAPDHESFWFERYGQIALTGHAMRFEHAATALNRHYEVYAFRVDEPELRHVAVLFNDIGERKRRESTMQLLDEVSRSLAYLTGVDETMAYLGARIGAHLNISRCSFGEVDDGGGLLHITYEWHRDGIPSTLGTYRLEEFTSPAFQRAMYADENFVIDDTTRDPRVHAMPLAALGVGAFICVPMLRDGQWRFALVVHNPEPRVWRDFEIDLIRELSNRIWSRLLRARAEQALRDDDRRKDEFLATLAHELRNPLAPIRTSLHILRQPGIPADTARQVHDMMDRQVTHMVRLVDDLMEVSRITRGKFELRKERVDIADVIRSAVETTTPLIEASRHSLETSLPEKPLLIDADAVRLAQVVSNLLNNAAKYTDKGGRIWLRAFRDGDTAVISVRDTGAGIPSAMLESIFDLFTQADRTYQRAQGGLGIGLTLARSLVSMHGGTVEARSEGPGHGSEFLVRLPLANEGKLVGRVGVEPTTY